MARAFWALSASRVLTYFRTLRATLLLIAQNSSRPECVMSSAQKKAGCLKRQPALFLSGTAIYGVTWRVEFHEASICFTTVSGKGT